MQQRVLFPKKIKIKFRTLLNKLLASDLLMRGIYMGLFFIITNLLRTATIIISVLQFLSVLFSDKQSSVLLKISEKLSTYCHNIDGFLMFNTEKKPFPFNSK